MELRKGAVAGLLCLAMCRQDRVPGLSGVEPSQRALGSIPPTEQAVWQRREMGPASPAAQPDRGLARPHGHGPGSQEDPVLRRHRRPDIEHLRRGSLRPQRSLGVGRRCADVDQAYVAHHGGLTRTAHGSGADLRRCPGKAVPLRGPRVHLRRGRAAPARHGLPRMGSRHG